MTQNPTFAMNLTSSAGVGRLSRPHIQLQPKGIYLVLHRTPSESPKLKHIQFSYFQTPPSFPQSQPKSLNVEPSPTVENNPEREQSDSLINHNAQNVVYLGVLLLAVSFITAMGILSRKIIWSVLFALVLSSLMIAVLWFFS